MVQRSRATANELAAGFSLLLEKNLEASSKKQFLPP
jgi:hypothetical protein